MSDESRIAQYSSEDAGASEQRELIVSEVTDYEIVSTQIYPYHRDPGYRPWLRKPGPPKPSPYEEILAIMKKHVNHAVIGAKCSLIFAIIIAFDLFLPTVPNEVVVTGYKAAPSGTFQMELNDGSVVNVSKKLIRKLKGKELTISRTRIFGVPYRISDKQNNTASVEISIYGNFIFMPLVLLATALLGVLYKRGFEFRFNLGVSSMVLSLFNIAFLHVHEF